MAIQIVGMRQIVVHFEINTDNLYTTDRPFITETKMWAKWLKVAFSAIKVGKAIIGGGFEDAFSAVKDLYGQLKTPEEPDFLRFMSEPLLKSEEQDALIEQLRENRFFDLFFYDAQDASWKCLMCKPK